MTDTGQVRDSAVAHGAQWIESDAAARRVSAFDVADAIGQYPPTEQQRAVIEAPLQPALVVAGAGSGKTETMANRVLWLIANGLVRPQEVLGLTFTRKAAGELGHRVRQRIDQLAAAGLAPASVDEFDMPAVSTYNSFASGIFREHALLLGRESDGALLGEAAAWQLARNIVIRSDDRRLGELGKSADQLTVAMLTLSQAMAEHLADPAEVRAFASRFAEIAELPTGSRGAFKDVIELASSVGTLPVLLDLVESYEQVKRERGLIEFSDQMALALTAVERMPRIADDMRTRYRVVLLDEYQDTSVVQTRLLAALFKNHPVMAVGDPNQAIYGWRGASAANLQDFAEQFGAEAGQQYSLSTSWRNGTAILGAANTLVKSFARGRVPVATLQARDGASSHPVDSTFTQTIAEEADELALWTKQRLAEGTAEGPATAAILLRTRSSQEFIVEALRRHGVPYHVLGVGGLLSEPEVADVVSALSVIHDPSAGSELVRLLAGSRWRIGPADLFALKELAGWLRDRDLAQQLLSDEVKAAFRSSVASGESGSIVEALDFVGRTRSDHSQLARFSAVGLERLREAAALFARLRSRASADLLELVVAVEHELMLDIELEANDSATAGRAAMEAFSDALTGYLAIDERASLGGFLSWLREAEWRERLAVRPEDPEPGMVQVLTMHASKGLEWDAVAVPRMVEQEMPAASREGTNGWLGFGRLPFDFRGDAADLPRFEWSGAETLKEVKAARDQFKTAVRDHQIAEERRLAYVAVTRARHRLLLTGSYWSSQTTPRAPGTFFQELVAAGILADPPERESDENPLGDRLETFQWPRDPLGARRGRVEAAATRVRAARARLEGRELADGLADAGSWGPELRLLLEERRRRLGAPRLKAVPDRVPASRFKDFVSDPRAVAAELLRPMPERPYQATRLGTLFHQWVEQRHGVRGSSETLDSSGDYASLSFDVDALEHQPGPGGGYDEAELVRLQRIFERSAWGDRAPIEVEREIHLVLDGQVIVCKIDAVYEQPDGTYQVVDWKTGKAPRDAADLERRQLQLALYRLAYAKWRGIDLSRISAAFYYVSDDRVIEPERIFDEEELARLWREAAS
ncbi:ATP-dependent helicase [Ruicaihuangia caeni]|uniref:DNA 3'-5' helicase n=1 Tax=Ruicaihuangia caeni TaxID=3042517 RepID=A0AAW6T982_9MICO|nr:ATP-dependent DNA helicase [Klugiella sp. YN-L-19]MDI2099676.1 ATP-dependent DNA helicase [Klugiella sp. YN-L-19]